mmetsp:Transcript_13540/g.17153  ORF Transcript_13540/g.17153 Transcript_13540/m.17153 type:complete len:98 (+) Transcript_13540:375-668(+)
MAWGGPLEMASTRRVEIFNEVSTFLVLYALLLFTEFVDNSSMRFNCGYAYLTVICVYALMHILLVTANTTCKVRLSCIRCVNRRCRKPKKLPRAPVQ